MSGSAPTIGYVVRQGIAHVTLANSARHNAMTLGMWQALPKAIAHAVADEVVRLIVIEGEGEKAFCAGADISEFGRVRSSEADIAVYNAAVASANAAIAHAEKPTIALIRGICFGGGVGLAMSCDLRLCTEDARFRIPAAKVGLGYEYAGIAALVRRIGMAGVTELLLSARILDARDALHYQIAHHAWPVATFTEKAAAYLAAMADNAPLTMQAVKRAMLELTKPEAERDAAATDALVAKCFASLDYREGRTAFLEKRRPIFRGK